LGQQFDCWGMVALVRTADKLLLEPQGADDLGCACD